MSQEEIKHKILVEALKIVPFEGWSIATVEKASVAAGHKEKMAELVFKNGVISVIDYYFQELDSKMVQQALKHKTKSVTENVKIAILARLKLLAKDKALVSRTVSFLAMPHNSIHAMKFIWRTADAIWHEVVADKSVDFNYYSKRTLLSGVYSSTIMFWLNDESKDLKSTEEFLDRRLKDVGKIGKFLASFK